MILTNSLYITRFDVGPRRSRPAAIIAAIFVVFDGACAQRNVRPAGVVLRRQTARCGRDDMSAPDRYRNPVTLGAKAPDVKADWPE